MCEEFAFAPTVSQTTLAAGSLPFTSFFRPFEVYRFESDTYPTEIHVAAAATTIILPQ